MGEMGETSQPPAGPSTLEARVEVMKREIDALQIQVMKDRGPWYKQVPVLVPLLVSVIALGFSFATTYVAEQRIEQEE
jgi:hypothetical protein